MRWWPEALIKFSIAVAAIAASPVLAQPNRALLTESEL